MGRARNSFGKSPYLTPATLAPYRATFVAYFGPFWERAARAHPLLVGAGTHMRGGLQGRHHPGQNSEKSKSMRACYEAAFRGRPRFFGVNFSSTMRTREKPLLTRVRGRLIRRSSANRVSAKFVVN